jgi:drug/metabolite transporter (DMT)-like permease
MFFVFLMHAFFASVFTIEKIALGYAQPLFLLGSRMFLAGCLMLCYQYLTDPAMFFIQKKHLGGFVGLSVFAIYITNACELLSLESMTSYKTCFIYGLSPFVSALFSYFFLSEGLTLKKWVGLTIGFLGFIPLAIERSSEELVGEVVWLSLPVMMMCLAMICSVYGWIQLKKLVRNYSYTPCMANGFSMCVGGALALVNSLIVEEWNPTPVGEFYPFLKYSILLLLISNFLCYNMYCALLKKFSATFLAFSGNTIPLFTALFGWVFLSEEITASFCISAVIVSFGLFLFVKDELQIAPPFKELHQDPGIKGDLQPNASINNF